MLTVLKTSTRTERADAVADQRDLARCSLELEPLLLSLDFDDLLSAFPAKRPLWSRAGADLDEDLLSFESFFVSAMIGGLHMVCGWHHASPDYQPSRPSEVPVK